MIRVDLNPRGNEDREMVVTKESKLGACHFKFCAVFKLHAIHSCPGIHSVNVLSSVSLFSILSLKNFSSLFQNIHTCLYFNTMYLIFEINLYSPTYDTIYVHRNVCNLLHAKRNSVQLVQKTVLPVGNLWNSVSLTHTHHDGADHTKKQCNSP